MNAEQLTVHQGVELYLEYLAHEQHASASTRMGYQSWLRRFLRFIAQQAVESATAEPLLVEVSSEQIRSYLYSLSRQGLRPRTLRGALYPVRGLFTMARERGYRPDNPALAVKLPKKDAAIRVTVSDAELEQLLVGSAREPDPERRPMSRAVLAVLIYGGLRRRELLDLQVSDVGLEDGRIHVRSGKGAKSRTVFVCKECVQALQEWLAVRPRVAHSYLFVTDSRRRLGDVGLSQLLTAAKSMGDLGEQSHLTPHAIRHAAATRLLRNGADLRSIQQFLGHSSLQTTAVYLHTDEQQLQRIAECGGLRRNPSPAPRTSRETSAAPRMRFERSSDSRNARSEPRASRRRPGDRLRRRES